MSETTHYTLSPARVEEIFKACHTDAEEPADNLVLVDAITWKAYLDIGKLAEHHDEIVEMLMELPEQFRESGGGGWSFLQACDDRHGVQWTGFHMIMAMLFALGEGIGKVKSLLPRDMWVALPGGMPYYVILDKP